MATKTLMDQLIAFAAPKETVSVARDPVSVFYAKIDRQIALVKEAREGKDVNARVAWFKRDGTSYRLKIGRDGLRFGDHQWFTATSLDDVIERLVMARRVIDGSDALKQQIATLSKARSERMKAGRKPRESKKAT